jgi:hypothetical protein
LVQLLGTNGICTLDQQQYKIQLYVEVEVSFMLQPLYTQEKSLEGREIVDPFRVGLNVVEKTSRPAKNQTPLVQLLSSHLIE